MEDTSKNQENTNNTNENQDQIENFENQNNSDYLNTLKEVLFKKRNNKSEQVKTEYKFWDTQPVPKIKSEDSTEIGPIDIENDLEKERKEPLKLPASFSWYEVDINNDSDLTKVKYNKIIKFQNLKIKKNAIYFNVSKNK